MKKRILLLLVLPFQLAFAQSEVALDSCYVWARNNYPNLKQSELWIEITHLKQENLGTQYLPQLSLNGQASYQSDVTEVPTLLPGVSIPTLSKDQYKAYAELHQNIWDGGMSKANSAVEEAILKTNLSQLEVELFQLNEQVAQAFFTVLVVEQQKKVIQAQIKTIDEQVKKVESAIKNGAMEASSALILQAEILSLKQNLIALDAGRNGAHRMLEILIGIELPESVTFQHKNLPASNSSDLLRPELVLFQNQRSQLDSQAEVLSNARNPRIFGFGQLGYGRPGLNMLLDEFEAYYLLGVGLSWNAFDWKNTTRKKQIIQMQKEMIQNQELTFLQNIELLLVQQKEQITKMEKMLESDNQMVALRSDITKSAVSKLENEAITTSDYIQELQAETIAKLNYELHKIQLNEAHEKYRLISGNSGSHSSYTLQK